MNLQYFVHGRSGRHFRLAFTAIILGLGVYWVLGFSSEVWGDSLVRRADDDVWRISMSAAWTSLSLLAIALGIGPLRVLRNRPIPLSIELRRDVGIWAGIAALTHLSFSLFSHARTPFVSPYTLWEGMILSTGADFKLELWPMFFWGHTPDPAHLWHFVHPRTDLFGLAVWLGIVQVAIVVMLLCTSNNVAMRSFGARRWKNLHRTVYVLWMSIGLHAFIFQLLETRTVAIRVMFGLIFLTVLGVQIAAFVKRRSASAGI